MNRNDVVGYLTLEERIRKKNRAYWKCLCGLCDREVEIREDTLQRNITISCGCYKKTKEFADKRRLLNPVEDLTGNVYHDLTVLYLSDKRVGKKIMWTCLCVCGNIVDVWSANLKNGNTKSCGGPVHRQNHLQSLWEQTLDDLTGKIYGDWLVLYRDGEKQPTKWICKCLNCGTIKSVIASTLKNGNSTSCGCRKHHESLVGQKIGHWDVLKRSKRKRPNGHFCTTYLCKCECGVERYVDETRLLNETSLSCGCFNSKANEYIANVLKANNYKFTTEYKYKDLVGPNNGLLRFDFALFDKNNNVACLIEYQGRQHFLNTDFGRQQREITDPLKTEYCQRNKIKLYRIKYNENIDKELDKILTHITC